MDRNKPPQVNLKDRIAAFQQRNAAASTSTSNSPAIAHQRSLKDKISQFEQKGGVPIPRGSFGLGAPAPPVPDGQKSRELYGNRIPTPVRVVGNIGNGPNSARVGSPMGSVQPSPLTGRKMSLTAAEFDEISELGSPSTEMYSYRALSPQNTGGSALQQLTPQTTGSAFLESLPRGTAFAAALEKARKLESGIAAERQLREGSVSPKALPQSRYLFTQNTGESAGSNDNTSDFVSNIPVPERRRSFLLPDIKDTVPLSPDSTFDLEPPLIQVTTELTPITSERDEETPPPSPFLSQPCYQDHVEILPTVMCSDCNAPVPLTELGDHHCAPPMSPLPEPEPIRELPEEDDTTVDNTLQAADVPYSPQDEPLVLEDKVAAELDPSLQAEPVTLEPEAQAVPESPRFEPEVLVEPAIAVEPQVDHLPPQVVSQLVPEPPHLEPEGLVEPQVVHLPPQVVASQLVPESPQLEPEELAEPAIAVAVEPQVVHLPPQVVVSQLVPESPQLEPEELLMDDSEITSPAVIPVVELQGIPESPQLDPVDYLVADVPRVVYSFEPEILVEADTEITPVATPSSPRRSPSQRTLPHRPVSMIVESPTRPSDPARGPFLLPLITGPEETEFGTVTLHRSSYSLSHSDDFVSHFTEPAPGLVPVKPSTFSAVVHGKVTELPARVGHLPASPQVVRRHKAIRDSLPMTPATGDLASLLANAALLEERLLQGELPSEEGLHVVDEEQVIVSPAETLESAVFVEHPPQWQPVEHIRPEESKSRRRPSFRNPLARSKSSKDPVPQVDSFDERTRTRSVYGAAHARAVSSYHPPPLPAESVHTRAYSQSSQASKPLVTDDTPPTPPPKSPVKYLGGLRRFTGRHSGSTSSEISSEDSMLIVTPPNQSPDFFTHSSLGQDPDASYTGGATTSKPGITWPSLSTKKSLGSLSRATSFAEKIWSRKRSKSSISNASEMGELPEIPPLPHSFDVPRVPPLPNVVLPPTSRPNAPSRSKSLYESRTSKEEDPGLVISIPALLAPPQQPSAVQSRPDSWVSVSTTSSSLTNPSPLLDMFDDFPEVPQSPPMPSPPGGGYRRPMSSFASMSSASVPRSMGGNLTSISSTTVHQSSEIRYTTHVQ